MKRYLCLAALLFIFSAGCGGGGGGEGGSDLGIPNLSGDIPDSSDDVSNSQTTENQDDGSYESQGEQGTSGEEAGPTVVLIKGILVGSEGVGIPGAEITFHSDPVRVTTDSGGMFEAFLEVGSHTFEAISGTYGDISGSITVSATNSINEAGRRIGNFVSEVQGALGERVACAAPRLADVVGTQGWDTAVGIWEGTFGHEVDSQGFNQTAIITGNSEMVANISIDGRLSGLYFPTVGAFNHIPYLSSVADWVKDYQGSFGGVKRGEDYYWFTDNEYWEMPVIEYNSTFTAPIIEITHTGKSDCSGATVKERIFVDYDFYENGAGRANVLVRDYQVTAPTTLSMLCRTSSNSSFNPEIAVYSRFNANSKYQLFKKWEPQGNDQDCENDRMYWELEVSPHYSIVTEGMDDRGSKQTMTCVDVNTLENARKVVADADCYPLNIAGTIAEWQIPSRKRLFVITAGCDHSSGPCDHALGEIESLRPTSLESNTSAEWSSWLRSIETVSNSTWRDHYKRWLVSLKMLSDRNTGAIIASPSQEPTYYYSWPRDGVYQSIAYIMSRKYDEAEDFFNYLFDMAQNWDGGWTQAHSSLDGSDLGLPSSPLRVSVEEDQPPTVLWGLWVFWDKTGRLPSSVNLTKIKRVADYVVSKICLVNGLIMPSLDWHENPYKDIGQSLYTNGAAHAGLLAAAQMVETSDSAAAVRYRTAASTIKEGVKNHLCSSTSCNTRIKYEPSWIGDLGTPLLACDHCTRASYSNDEGERIMAFAWPFHLFELGDPRVQSYYARTKETHERLTDFSKDNCLWIPRFLYSHLYALEAANNSEVPAGSFKSNLSSDISTVESYFPSLMTDVDYLMDQYVGSDEDEIYGPEYAGQKLGSAARPLGWSQAMGILSALGREGKRVPMIEIPFSCSDECATGAVKCDVGRLYNCTTDTHGCLVWDSGTACVSGSCLDAAHCAGCAPADHNGCYNDDVYSFDSCGVRESLVYDCGVDEWTGSPYCQSGDVYQYYLDRGCSEADDLCVASSAARKKEECGTAGCASGACCDDNDSYACYSGDVYWYSSCGSRQSVKEDCGSSGYTGSDYCYSGDVYRDYVTRECSSDRCTSSTERRLQEDCGGTGCSGGACNTGGCPSGLTWTNNALTLSDAGWGVRISWSEPSPDWVDFYVVARSEGSYTPPPSASVMVAFVPTTVDGTAVRGHHYTYAVYAYHSCDSSNHKAVSRLAAIDY